MQVGWTILCSQNPFWPFKLDLDNSTVLHSRYCLSYVSEEGKWRDRKEMEGIVWKTVSPHGYTVWDRGLCTSYSVFLLQVQLANQTQLVDHYSSKHPKEKLPSDSGWLHHSFSRKIPGENSRRVLLLLDLLMVLENVMSVASLYVNWTRCCRGWSCPGNRINSRL